MSMEVINPVTGKMVQSYTEHSAAEVKQILEQSQQAFLAWRNEPFARKSTLMIKAAECLERKKAEYARLMTIEMGKPISQSRSEIDKCALLCRYYAQKAEAFLADEMISTDASKSYVSFQPLGLVLAVMPWNFPFWQVFRFLVPALMAGNGGILKHASNVPGCALAIEEVVREAGFPENIFRSLLIGSREVAAVIEHPHIKAVTLTGSTPAGKAVASAAGAVLKKTVLELGGSDPYIILEDADLESAVNMCVQSRMINGGQSCISAKRFIVVESLKNDFEKLFVSKMKEQVMGDPLKEETTLGPQARHDLRDQLHEQVRTSIKDGARLLLGGVIPDLEGAYYPPTVLTDVDENVLSYHDELFGPVASIISAKDEQDAVRKANDSIFGLGAAVFSKDKARAERIARNELEAGACFVNAFVRSDARLPFGGIKESGYGRELSSFGIREFVNIKTVYVK
ncbi:MAG: NAD-dependent succinate-semialdehyde dehydrogenase [Candidatus Omnitrophota bacterium]